MSRINLYPAFHLPSTILNPIEYRTLNNPLKVMNQQSAVAPHWHFALNQVSSRALICYLLPFNTFLAYSKFPEKM